MGEWLSPTPFPAPSAQVAKPRYDRDAGRKCLIGKDFRSFASVVPFSEVVLEALPPVLLFLHGFQRYDEYMGSQVVEKSDAPSFPAAEAPIRGRFRPGDPRINRAGRPKGADRAARQAIKGQPLSGRLMTVLIPEADLRQSLTNDKHVWLVNLPSDFRLVAFALDPARAGVIVTIHSETFAAVSPGEPIPEMAPSYNGLKWRAFRT